MLKLEHYRIKYILCSRGVTSMVAQGADTPPPTLFLPLLIEVSDSMFMKTDAYVKERV